MNRTRGFTLIELTLTLAIGSLAILLGALLWRQALSAGSALEQHRSLLDLRAGGRRWLASALGSIEAGATGDVPFMGHQSEVAFSSWLPGARGWPVPQAVSIGLSDRTLQARLSDGGTIPIADSVAVVGFDYLLQPGLNAQWASVWESPVSAPLAIRIRITGFDGAVDTLLFLVGARG